MCVALKRCVSHRSIIEHKALEIKFASARFEPHEFWREWLAIILIAIYVRANKHQIGKIKELLGYSWEPDHRY